MVSCAVRLLVMACSVNMLAGMLDAQGLVQKTKWPRRRSGSGYAIGCISVRAHYDYDGENQTLTISGATQFGSLDIGIECSTNKTYCLWFEKANTSNYVNDSRMVNDTRRAEISVTLNATVLEISFDPDRSAPPKHLYIEGFDPIPAGGWDVDDLMLKGDYPMFQTFELMWGPVCLEQGTAAPTPAPPPHIVGDPHCANLRGERFDVTAVGKLPMVVVPQGKNASEADFAVISYVQPFRLKKCDPTYVQRVDIMWDSNCGRSVVRVGKDVPELDTVAGERGHKCHSIKTVEHRGPNTTIVNVANFSVIIKQQHVIRKSLLGHKRLDMEVRGLKDSNLPVGGLMGLDDYSQYVYVSPECSARTALFENSPVNLEPDQDAQSSTMQSFMYVS